MRHPHPTARRFFTTIFAASTLAAWSPTALVASPASNAVVSADPVAAEGTPLDAAAQVRRDRDTRVLALGPTGSLELKTVSGSITVTAGTDKDVHLEIVREARGRSDSDAQAGLDAVKVMVDHQGERATVSVSYPQDWRRDLNVSVSYTVSAPAGTRVSASSVSGNISVRDIKGDVSVNSTSGTATATGAGATTSVKSISGNVSVADVTGGGNLTVTSVSGDVLIDHATVRRIEANAISGRVTARNVAAEQATLHSISGTIEYAGSLARGGRYELQSHSGEVRLIESGTGGFELQASTFSGQIHAGDELGLKAVSQTNRSMRGTVGDGSAVVSATTFSGNVTIGRK